MTRLILIRHGETDYSLEKRYCGVSNPPLNKTGIWQCKKLSVILRKTGIDKVYSSDLKRALQSAKLIFKGRTIEQAAAFREMNFGIYEGLRYEDIIKKYPDLYSGWLREPSRLKIPDGEGLKELSERVVDKLSLLLSVNKDKAIALVAHSGPIRAILCDALRLGLEGFWQIGQEICALNIIYYTQGSAPAIIRMNDTSYLSAGRVTKS